MALTKANIVESIHSNLGFTKAESSEMVESVLDIIKNTLEAGEKIKIAGFGNFVVKQKADRNGRNPHTGEALTIEARKIVAFKPSPVLRNKVNTGLCSK